MNFPYTELVKSKNLKFSVTGHSSGLGKRIIELFGGQGFSRTNGFNIEQEIDRSRIIEASIGCDVFINCAHSSFFQTNLLYEADRIFENKIIVNMSSNTGDGIKDFRHPYASEKSALDKASEQLFYDGRNRVINLRPGFFDSPRVKNIEQNKMKLEEVIEAMCFCMSVPFSVKEMTFVPPLEK